MGGTLAGKVAIVTDAGRGIGRAGGRGVWQWAFAVLGVGGFLGICCMLWLRALPESRRLAGGKR